ncbi:MAG: hypothetical protein ACT4OX_07250 [Actinomycetota bacterium]
MITIVATSPRAALLANLHLIPMMLFVIGAFVASMSEAKAWFVGALLCVAITHAALAVRIGRLGVDATAAGLVIHNVYRTVPTPFAQIASVGVDALPRIPGKRAVFVERDGGRRVYVFGTSAGRWSWKTGRALMTDAEQAVALHALEAAVTRGHEIAHIRAKS